MRVLDLFSGIGGFSLGLERAGMETIAFCEFDEHARKVLKKHWPDVPIHEDVRLLDGNQYRGSIDVICGGYPCQPFSVAGLQEGDKDDRHLWPDMLRIIKQARPTWVIAENVTGHITLGLDKVLSDLEVEGYTSRTLVIPACALNAHHRRDRVWIIAYSDSERRCSGNASGENAKDARKQPVSERVNTGRMEAWDVEPSMGRVANGVPRRTHRLKQLGNAVVPQIPEVIGKAIMNLNA